MDDQKPTNSKGLNGGMLTRNLHYKVLAVLLAGILWFYAANERGITRDRVFDNIPIVVQGLASEHVISSPLNSVQVTLQGNVEGLDAKDIIAYIDLSGISSGEATVPIHVNIPSGATFVGVKPSRVTVLVEERAERRITVEVKLQGNVPEGYISLTPEIKPTQVLVVGGKEQIAAIQSAYVDFDLRNSNQTLTDISAVKLSSSTGVELNNVQINPANVEVKVPIMRNELIKTVPVKARLLGSPANGYQVSEIVVEPTKVEITGAADVIGSVTEIQTNAIPLDGIEESTTRTVLLAYPAGVQSIHPAEVTVHIRLNRQIEEREISGIPVQVENLPENLVLSGEIPTFTCRLTGSAERLNQLTSRDFSGYIDLVNLEAGSHQVTIHLTAPGDTQVVEIKPKTVEVLLVPKSVEGE